MLAFIAAPAGIRSICDASCGFIFAVFYTDACIGVPLDQIRIRSTSCASSIG